MKKLRVLVCALLSVGLLLLSVACAPATVASPSGFALSDDYMLSWFTIPEARRYEVEICSSDEGAENAEPIIRTVSRPNVALADLPEGNYAIRVRSVTGRNYDVVSEWSEKIEFEREHESGILYEAANGNTEYTVAGAGTLTGELKIDEFYRKKPVTSVKMGAFRGNASIERVELSSGITSIGNRAFYNCGNLREIVFPEKLTSIGSAAFQACTALTEVTIPDSVGYLDTLTFGYCTALERVTLGSGLNEIGNSAFYSCTALREIRFPDALQAVGESAFALNTALEKAAFGTGIRTVGLNAFRGAGLSEIEFSALSGELTLGNYSFAETAFEKVDLPEGTTSLGLGAFMNAQNLREVTLPETVIKVGAAAFRNTALYDSQNNDQGDGLIYVDEWLVDATAQLWSTVRQLGGESSDPQTVPVQFRPNTFGIADQAFVKFDSSGSMLGCPELYSIDFPASLRYLGDYCFASAANLYRMHAPYENSLIKTGDFCFAGCVGLTNVMFSRGLTRIEAHTFYGCQELDNNSAHPDYLTPDTLTSIGKNAFAGTKILNAADDVAYAGNWLVGYDLNLYLRTDSTAPVLTVELPENIVGIAEYALGGCGGLRNIDLTGVQYIGRSAFTHCVNLSLVTFDFNLLEIPAFAFYSCSALHHVDFPLAVQSVGRYAFYLTDLTAVDLSGTFITEIGDHAFYGLSNMSEVKFPSTLEKVGDYAFFRCNRLASVKFPDSCTEIGERAFAECSGLQRAEFGNRLKTVGAHAFRNCTSLTSIDLPDSCTEIGDFAFLQCTAVSSLDLGGAEQIGNYAFSFLASLNRVAIPASVKSVGDGAFFGCNLLTSVTFSDPPAYVGANAFYGSRMLTLFCPFASGETEEWNSAWNIGLRPVLWGVVLSEEGYVVSIEWGENAISNPFAIFGISEPVRTGYRFMGWSTDPAASKADYSVNGLHAVPAGTTLYAVWDSGVSEPEPSEPSEPEESEQPALPDSETPQD